MNAVFRALVWGHLASNKLRTGVTVLAVALGVAIALSVDLANATAVASFASSVNVISNHVNLQVLGVGHGFDDRSLLRVQSVPGVLYASPTIEDSLTIGARPHDAFSGDILRVLGIDLLRPVPGSAGITATPGAIATGTKAVDPYVLVNEHGAFVSARIAAKYHWHAGSLITALAGDRTVYLRVAVVLPAAVAGIDSSVVFVDIATAQELFNKLHTGSIGSIASSIRRMSPMLPPPSRA